MSDEPNELPAETPARKTARRIPRKKALAEAEGPVVPVAADAPVAEPAAGVSAVAGETGPGAPEGEDGKAGGERPQVRRISHKPELPPRRDEHRSRDQARGQDRERGDRDEDRRRRQVRDEDSEVDRDGGEEGEPIAFIKEPPSSEEQGGGKRRRRRRKGKGGREDGQDRDGRGPAQAAPGQPPQRPQLDAEQVEKRAWKIFLSEVSEEGLALINDQDAKEISRRAFRLAEIFLEEAARRQG